MSIERLLKNFERVADAPNAVPLVRRFILDVAVRGKLVPQDPNDEPMSAALRRQRLPVCQSGREPLPSSWCVARLGDLLAEDTRNGYSRRPDEAATGIPILRISAGTVRRDGVVAEEEHKLISGITADVREQYGLRRGDLLACRFSGNKEFVGRLSIFQDYAQLEPIFPDKLIRIRLVQVLALPEYVRSSGESDVVRASIESFCATTVGNWGISASNLREVLIPLPPLAEQRRIVAKVDELTRLSQLDWNFGNLTVCRRDK